MPAFNFDIDRRFRGLKKALERMKEEGVPELEEASRAWAAATEEAAKRRLPSDWRLTNAITSKVLRYGTAYFTVVGVPLPPGMRGGKQKKGFARRAPRSLTSAPGFYARFQEFGYKAWDKRGERKAATRPRYFLARAKQETAKQARAAVEEACQKIAERMRSAVAEETAKGGSQ
ncbi:MAG: hypothetical protein IJE77_02615 [Thermoguttaceae bacterium]|nr:hypothetical protein [Thermoguttaceae bacterium]